MNIAQMRTAIADAYSRRTWRTKVKNMSDEQVLAIYKSMVRDGRLFDHVKREHQKVEEQRHQQYEQMQMTLEREVPKEKDKPGWYNGKPMYGTYNNPAPLPGSSLY